jgi:ATP-dependent DNA helicase RecG
MAAVNMALPVPSETFTNGLTTPLKDLSGIGPKRAEQLARLGCTTVGDLLLHAPRRYEDRRRFCPIAELRLGQSSITRGTVVAMGINYFRRCTKSVFVMILEDGSARLYCRWWNAPYMQQQFQAGETLLVFRKPHTLRPRTIDQPEIEKLEEPEENFIHLQRIVPVYPLTEGLPQRWLCALIWRLLESGQRALPEPWPNLPLPDLPTHATAIHWLHFPAELREGELARKRLALDEFMVLQLAMLRRRRNFQTKAAGLPCGGDNRWMKPWLAGLGFSLTAAQTHVLREIRLDMRGRHPMRRLLQGDVGSGKTVVAAACALMALENGYNVALMAPTEILAEQHFQSFQQWFAPLGIQVQLHTGSHKSPAATAPCMVIGTHALIEEQFVLEKLGLVIIDEQHKFGVVQRETLVRKGCYPHLLVMTATPIPRTLGLTLYGDLGISIMNELPAGRGQIKTYVRTADRLPRVWQFIRQKLAEGRQAYVVYPLVDESDKAELKAVTREWDRLQEALAPFQVGLLHGRLPAEEKERVMATFRAGHVHVLLATTVIEVGLDVANATLMLVENAEQFGLAQLHQLRGRIGRGARDAYCILVANAKTGEAKRRLQVLAETTDGFRIAEADLQLRGPGELLGLEQSGLPSFRFGNLATDIALVERARSLAKVILGQSAS